MARAHLLLLLGGAIMTGTATAKERQIPTALGFTMKSLEGKEVPLSNYQGKVILVVNLASRCGLTPQYEQLQALYEQYSGKGPGGAWVSLQPIPGAGTGDCRADSQFLPGQLRRAISDVCQDRG